MKRQICSYDMLAVPSRSYTVSDEEGEMYFCNSRRLCLWAMMLVTKPKLPEGDREQAFVMTLPDGKKRSFDALVELAQWSAANAIGNLESEWLTKGREALYFDVANRFAGELKWTEAPEVIMIHPGLEALKTWKPNT